MPGRRITRSQSASSRAQISDESRLQLQREIIARRIREETMESINVRTHFENCINRIDAQIKNADEFNVMQIARLEELLKHAETNYDKFEAAHLKVISDPGQAAEIENHNTVMVAVESVYLGIREAVRARIIALTPAQTQIQNQHMAPPEFRVEVSTHDALGNIPNTWGTFSGDYSQWHSFRDRFKAAVHDNPRMQTAFKFQYLKAALTGDAARAMGSWTMTDANYPRAWERLCEVFEDDYLAVQTLIRRLLSIPQLQRATHNGLRNIIDTVHECVEQLSTFVPVTQWDPMIVFLVIDRLDGLTYDAWETHRASLEPNEVPMDVEPDENEQPPVVNVRKANVPTWAQLQSFLDTRSKIMVHAEGRQEPARLREQQMADNNRARSRSNQRKPSGASGNASANTKKSSGWPACRICKADHPLYKCITFGKMDLARRLLAMEANPEYCHGCLRMMPTDHKCPQKPCDRCNGQPIHNSLLCQTREAERRTLALTTTNEQAPQANSPTTGSKLRRRRPRGLRPNPQQQ